MRGQSRAGVGPIKHAECQTHAVDGASGGLRGNTASQRALCDAAASNPQVHCAQLEGLDHFSVIDVAARLMAARMTQAHLAAGTPQGEFSLSFPGEQTR